MKADRAWGFCPQCGGKVSLEVGDPLLKCAFCKTSLYIIPKDGIFSYVLVTDDMQHIPGSRILMLPYWRLKGLRFSLLQDKSVKSNRVDATIPALKELKKLPSLGLVTQLATLRLNTGPVSNLQMLEPIRDVIRHINARIEAGLEQSPLTSFVLSEKISIVMAPFELLKKTEEKIVIRPLWTKGHDFVKITDRHIIQSLLKREERIHEKKSGHDFLPLICPECGSDLPALSMVSVLFCPYCKRLYSIGQSKILPQKAQILCRRIERNMVFVPFYHFQVAIEGDSISFHDRLGFLSRLYSYKMFPKDLSKEPVQFVVPAFSVNPSLFLRLSSRFSSSEVSYLNAKDNIDSIPEAYAINISAESAVQCLPLLLLFMVGNKRKLMEQLIKAKIRITSVKVIFIPFFRQRNELVEKHTGQAIQERAIKYGMNL